MTPTEAMCQEPRIQSNCTPSRAQTHSNRGLVYPTRGKGAVVRHGLLAETKGPEWQLSREKAAWLRGISPPPSQELLIRIMQLHGPQLLKLIVHVRTHTHKHFVYRCTATLTGMDTWIEPTHYNAYTYILNPDL